MAKIEISTVKREANVECIFLNASIISRVIRAKNVLEHIFENHMEFRKDHSDPNWGDFCMSERQAIEIEDYVLDFINEVVDAMLDEEK